MSGLALGWLSCMLATIDGSIAAGARAPIAARTDPAAAAQSTIDTPSAEASGLELYRIATIDDPLRFDLENPLTGDVRSVERCGLRDGTTVSVERSHRDKTDTIRTAGPAGIHELTIGGVGTWDRVVLACHPSESIYLYGHTERGTVTAYRGDGTQAFEIRISPFDALDPGQRPRPGMDYTGKNGLLAMQIRQSHLLVEWMEMNVGMWHEVFELWSLRSIGRLGPDRMILRSAAEDPWWTLFIGRSPGGTFQYSTYVPQALYELRVGRRDGPAAARAVLAALAESTDLQSTSVATVDTTALRRHVLALLTPLPASRSEGLDFCPSSDPALARAWLGPHFDPLLAARARELLLGFWNELEARWIAGGRKSARGPLDEWFRRDVLTAEPMREIWAKRNPTDPAWVRSFQAALLEPIGPWLERLEREPADRSSAGVEQAPPASPTLRGLRVESEDGAAPR